MIEFDENCGNLRLLIQIDWFSTECDSFDSETKLWTSITSLIMDGFSWMRAHFNQKSKAHKRAVSKS